MNDNELRALIKSQTRTDKGNPFFVKKVMNRLPERPRHPLWWLMPAAYLVSFVVLALFWADYLTQPVAIERSLVSLLALWAMTLLWVFALIRKPLLRSL